MTDEIPEPTTAFSGCEPAVWLSFILPISGGWLAPLMLIVRLKREQSEQLNEVL